MGQRVRVQLNQQTHLPGEATLQLPRLWRVCFDEEMTAVSRSIKSWAAGFATVAALAAAPVAIATIQTPAISKAEVCADAGGRHVDVGGCSHIAGDAAAAGVAGAAIAGDDEAAAQAAAGRPPCIGPNGVPYYTPGDDPCN
jgi:hypothetical protein